MPENIGLIELFRDFLEFMLNIKGIIPRIFQDNTSIVEMVTIDSRVSSTKHMCMQMHLVLEAVKDKHVDIKYRNTKQMIADEFTKPLDGAKSETFRSEILHLSD